MAMAHVSVTHENSAASTKTDAHPAKRQFVPIRPAFRPLLPKPCTKEPSLPNGIHIHTRSTVLGSSRKRLSASKADAQKRRKSYNIAALAGSKPARTEQRLDGEAAGANLARHAPLSTPKPADVGGFSAGLAGAFAKGLVNSPSADGLRNSGLPSQRQQQDLALNTDFTPSFAASPASASIMAKGASSNGLFSSSDKMSSSVSIPAALEEQTAPATPVSISESPTSVNTASIFCSTRSESTPSGTIDPMNIVADGEDFGLDAAAEPLPALSNFDPMDNTTLTPPDTQKPFATSAFSGFSSSTNEFDGFSDFYFRSENTTLAPADMNNTGESEYPVALSLDNPRQAPELDISGKDDEFSILEYLAPAADPYFEQEK